MHSLVCERRSNDDVGGARGTVVQEIRRGAGFKHGVLVTKDGGGQPTTTRKLLYVVVSMRVADPYP